MEDRIAVVAALRSPIGAFLGQSAAVPVTASAAMCARALVTRTSISLEHIGALYLGCVFSAGLGAMPARQVAHHAKLSSQTLCRLINQAGCSGLASIQLAVEGLKNGAYQAALAGGMECMSGTPYLIQQMRQGHPLGTQPLVDGLMRDWLLDPLTNQHIGSMIEAALEETALTRVALDNYVVHSLTKACQAQDAGLFANELLPIRMRGAAGTHDISEDEWPKRLRQRDLALCRPSFKEDGCITSASSAPLADGCSMMLLVRGNEKTFTNIPVLGYVSGFAYVGDEPQAYLTIASRAIRKLLEEHKLNVSDIDVFEIQETFACTPLITIQELNIPGERVNPYGGGCALGDPLGAGGARMLTTLLHYLNKNQLKRGVAVVTQAGCEALAVLVVR